MTEPNIITKSIPYINRLLDIVKNTHLAVHRYKLLHLLDSREVYNCTLSLQNIAVNLKNVLDLLENNTNVDEDSCEIALSELAWELLALIKTYGTQHLEDLFYLLLGGDNQNCKDQHKYNLLKQFAHPISYVPISYVEYDNFACINYDCINYHNKVETNETVAIADTIKNFNLQVQCIKIVIREKTQSFLITCLIDDINLDMLHNEFIRDKLETLKANTSQETATGETATGETASETASETAGAVNVIQWYDYLNTPQFIIFRNCLTLKDLLIYNEGNIHNNYLTYMNNISEIQEKPIAGVVEEFLKQDLYHKRTYLMYLLFNTADQEAQYLAYLLYDLLSNDLNDNVDTVEQNLLFDSLPFKLKQLFHSAMREMIIYTKKLSHSDLNNIPLEQRICLLKTPDSVKEKALLKLKEIKAKGDDSGSKPRHYLDGLLQIPFKVLKEEPILHINQECIEIFTKLLRAMPISIADYNIELKPTYNSLEVQKYSHVLKTQGIMHLETEIFAMFTILVNTANRRVLLEISREINTYIKTQEKAKGKTATFVINITKKIPLLRLEILEFLNNQKQLIPHLFSQLSTQLNQKIQALNQLTTSIKTIEDKFLLRTQYLSQVNKTLDDAVYGHAGAKRQLERIIGQWINGENKGYCFGFEGPPGVGKTSLAKKGIADCLKDASGQSRPFSFIAIGGSANGSTLEGHNYTYVGSTWGKVVDILMEKKCMNPIIFIDELDKVSKTEHGKEIISILTHLVDPTQNDTFQDKYFSGIDIDVSNILFVFSYNDAQLIDKILLDRIHRIKFDNLSLADKLVIAQKFILPEIYKKMGLTDVLVIADAEIEFIIEEYTAESGVRKLKELLFDIVGEINLELLTGGSCMTFPIQITKQDIIEKYLKDRDEVKLTKIHPISSVGCINGLWANALGKGGVLPIEANYFPASTFLDLRLTGMQGDVMKESMNVAKTLAWSLLTVEQQKELEISASKQGIHIHVPEGATPKDGPSAGTAITVVMYSLFTGKKIKHDLAITGEICLSGRITAIGGLDLKILGGIKAGVKTFLFPKENLKDFVKLEKKYGEKPAFKEIKFYPVEEIKEVLTHTFL